MKTVKFKYLSITEQQWHKQINQKDGREYFEVVSLVTIPLIYVLLLIVWGYS